jgi:FAD/FMN-containing dehydrogenases
LHACRSTLEDPRTKSGPQAAAARTLDTRRLTGIRKYALEDLYVTVGAGTSLQALQAELAQDNMWVPLVSPWPEATLGGIVAANFNAPLRMRYGYRARIRNHGHSCFLCEIVIRSQFHTTYEPEA